MKIVWIVPDMNVSGRTRAICELSAQVVERGHEVEVLYPRGHREVPLPPGVRDTACGVDVEAPLSSLLLNLPALLINVPSCDWILCTGSMTPLVGMMAAKLRGARARAYACGDERTYLEYRSGIDSDTILSFYRTLTDWTQRLPLPYLANSQWTATRLRHGRGRECVVIPYGVNPAIFRAEGPRMVKEEVFTILTLGSPDPRKGMSDLVQALNRLAKEVPSQRFQLWVVTRQEVDLSAAKFQRRIFGAATDAELAAALRSADLLVYPSWEEGFGLLPLEAMACGTAAVIADSGGVREYARHNVNCLLIPPRDTMGLAGAITTCQEDVNLRDRLVQGGLETARRFTWKQAAAHLESILSSRQ